MNAPIPNLHLSDEKRQLLAAMLASRGKPAPAMARIPRRDPVQDAVCSYQQARLWLLDQFEGAGAAYNMPGRIHLNGVLDVNALQRALDAVVARHAVLRTQFRHHDGAILQVETPAAGLALPFADLASAPGELEATLAEEASTGFDLARGPLIRARLLRLAADAHLLLVTMHHIVSDGWSLQVLAGEIGALYAAFLQGRPDPLPPLSIQYADYAAWQRSEAGSAAAQSRLAWWTRELAGAPSVLELPLDRPRGVAQSYRGAEMPFALDAACTARLRALARREGLTLFMVLHAGFAILLSRLSRQQDVVIGTPVANRRHSELENLIGFFVNTLALRVKVRPDATVAEFLAAVRDTTLAALEHQDTPFDQVVESLNPARSASYNPLFQVMFALQNAPRREAVLPGLEMRLEMAGGDAAKFDITLTLHDDGDDTGVGLDGTINFASDLFERRTIERWAGHLRLVLDAIVQDPSRRIDDLPLLTEDELAEVVERFNSTRRDYPRDRLSHHLFELQAARQPEALAVECAGERLTYAQLEWRANQLARHLRAHGVGIDSPVAICVERSADTAIGVLAILKAGGAYVPIDPDYPADRIHWMLQDADPRVVLTHSRLQPSLLLAGRTVISLDTDAAAVAAYDGGALPALAGHGPQHLGYVIYTSGSTGRPKGVALPHGALVNLIEWHVEVLRPARRVLQFASLSFDASFHELFAAWFDGGSIVIPGEEVRRDSRLLAEFIHDHGIDKVILPVVMLHHLAERYADRPEQFRSLREVMATGEQLKITPAVRDLFAQLPGCRLHNHYGPSETHVVTAATLDAQPAEWPTYPSIGTPIANCSIYILDARGRPVPVGVLGEVWIGGVGVARGYLNRPELTAERFVTDPFAASSDATMYRSGDLGRWHADGSIEFLGRNDHQLKIRGFRVEPGEVESCLLQYPSVREAVVIAREDVVDDRRLVAYLTVAEAVTADLLRDHVRAALPDYMMPAAFVVLEALPLTPNGKLDRDALPAPDRANLQVRAYEPPQGDIESTLAAAWQALLGLEQVGRHDNFFELGGHSLLALQAVSRAADTFGVELCLRDLFDRQTPAALAAYVETLQWARNGLAAAASEASDLRERATI